MCVCVGGFTSIYLYPCPVPTLVATVVPVWCVMEISAFGNAEIISVKWEGNAKSVAFIFSLRAYPAGYQSRVAAWIYWRQEKEKEKETNKRRTGEI